MRPSLCLTFLFGFPMWEKTERERGERVRDEWVGQSSYLRVDWQPDKQLKRNIAYLLAAAADDLAVFNASSSAFSCSSTRPAIRAKPLRRSHVNAICERARLHKNCGRDTKKKTKKKNMENIFHAVRSVSFSYIFTLIEIILSILLNDFAPHWASNICSNSWPSTKYLLNIGGIARFLWMGQSKEN